MASSYEFIKPPLSDFYGFISFYLFINTLFYITSVPIKRLTTKNNSISTTRIYRLLLSLACNMKDVTLIRRLKKEI